MRSIFDKIPNSIDFKNKVILDAGSGSQSLDFLTRKQPSKIFSVSINPTEVDKNRKDFQADNIRFIEADLTKATMDTQVDIAFCDYFFAGVEGYSPFKTIDAIQNISKSISQNGLMVMIGWEPLSNPQTEEDKMIMEIQRKRDAIKAWLGEVVYREIPNTYLQKLLVLSGLEILSITKENTTYELDFFTIYLQSMQNRAEQLENESLKDGLDTYIRTAKKKIENLNFPIIFGEEYIVVARKNQK